MKCFEIHCEDALYCQCMCQQKPIFLCSKHRQSHLENFGPHSLQSLPDHSLFKVQEIGAFPSLTQSQDFYFCAFQKQICALGIVIEDAEVPQNWKICLKNIRKTFVKKLVKLTKGEKQENEEIRNLCLEFETAMRKIIPNYQSSEDFKEIVQRFFIKMHSKIERELALLIENLVNFLKVKLQMPETCTVNFFYKANLKAAEQDFFGIILLAKGFDIKQIMEAFCDKFRKFYSGNIDISVHFKSLETDYYKMEAAQIADFACKVKNYLKSVYESVGHCRVSVISQCYEERKEPENTENLTPIFSRLFLKGEFSITQALEVSNELFFTIIDKSRHKAFIAKVNQTSVHIVLILESINVVIASGSTFENFAIFENHQKSRFLYRLIKNKLVQIERIMMNSDLFSKVTSAVYIDTCELLLCTTETGDILCNKNRDINELKSLNPLEKKISLYFDIGSQILSIVTDDFLHFFTGNLRILYSFQWTSKPISFFEYGAQLCYFPLSELKVYSEFLLTPEDFSMCVPPRRSFSMRQGKNLVQGFLQKVMKKSSGYKKVLNLLKVEITTNPTLSKSNYLSKTSLSLASSPTSERLETEVKVDSEPIE